MKKGVIIAIILIAGLGGIFYLFQNNQAQAPVVEDSNPQSGTGQSAGQNQQTNNTPDQAASTTASSQTNAINNTSTPDHNGAQFSSGEGEPVGPDIQVVEIDYDGAKYTPSSVDIKVNDYVIFKNKSNMEFWPASAPHPSHTNYPEFDAKKPIAAAGKYQFQFAKAGNWGFHDHLNPSAYGKINVTQ